MSNTNTRKLDSIVNRIDWREQQIAKMQAEIAELKAEQDRITAPKRRMAA